MTRFSRTLSLISVFAVLGAAAFAVGTLGGIVTDKATGNSLIDTCAPTTLTPGGWTARLRLTDKVTGLTVVNIQSGNPVVSGPNFSATSNTALVGKVWYGPGQTAGTCQASFDWTNGTGSWVVVKDGKIISQGEAAGATISVSAGPS